MAEWNKYLPELNWRTGEGYVDHGNEMNRWAWEFLRRNPEYISDWEKCFNTAKEWANNKGVVKDKFSPEDVNTWLHDIYFVNTLPFALPMDVLMGNKWGLLKMECPSNDCINSFLIKDSSMITFTDFSFEAREYGFLLNCVLNAIDSGAEIDAIREMVEYGVNKLPEEHRVRSLEGRDKRLSVEFDYSLDTKKQFLSAEKFFRERKNRLIDIGIVKEIRNVNDSDRYTTYLRVFDAFSENSKVSRREIASNLMKEFHGSSDVSPLLLRVSGWKKRAEYLVKHAYDELPRL